MKIYSLDILLSYLEPVCCSMSSYNCWFLTCLQVYQEASEVVWYSHHFKKCQHCIVLNTVKGFSIVTKAELGVFLEFLAFLIIHWMLTVQSLVPLPFLKPVRESFPRQVDKKSRGPQGQRGLQMEEIACKCQTFLSLLSSRRKQTSNIFFPSLYKFKGRFLLKYCVAIMTPGFAWS